MSWLVTSLAAGVTSARPTVPTLTYEPERLCQDPVAHEVQCRILPWTKVRPLSSVFPPRLARPLSYDLVGFPLQRGLSEPGRRHYCLGPQCSFVACHLTS
ncbi:hypothetical protein EDB89DRAFT_1945037 [Lactarius sanguifluus]|nr:hypothetical protein EDB89DRAFT_1945037 [Lactarius sanguifluus]